MVLHSAVPSASRLKLSLESQNVSDSPLFKYFKQFQTFRQQLDEILLLNYTFSLETIGLTQERSNAAIRSYTESLFVSRKLAKKRWPLTHEWESKNQQCQVKPTEWFWLSKNLSNTEHHCTETANLLHPMTAYQMRNSPTRANRRKHKRGQNNIDKQKAMRTSLSNTTQLES